MALNKNLLQLRKHAMHVAADDLPLPSPRNFSAPSHRQMNTVDLTTSTCSVAQLGVPSSDVLPA
jgi:hypothetical protein